MEKNRWQLSLMVGVLSMTIAALVVFVPAAAALLPLLLLLLPLLAAFPLLVLVAPSVEEFHRRMGVGSEKKPRREATAIESQHTPAGAGPLLLKVGR